MKQPEAFVVALALLIGGTVVSRRYLSRNAQVVLGALVMLVRAA